MDEICLLESERARPNPFKGIAGVKPQKEDKLDIAYRQEHVDLIAAITTGNHINESQRLAESTLTAIMGRMSAYTGREVSWDDAMKSKLDLWPKEPLAFGPFPVAAVAMPGKDQLV